jgi:cellobiose phosphorylase
MSTVGTEWFDVEKVIFLDIDGVLNNERFLHEGGIHTIADPLIAILKRIVDATGAKIVLSSTWRIAADNRRRVKEALARHDLEFVDRTVELRNKMSSWVERSFEILEWLHRHQEVKNFAILDDCSDAGTNGLREYFFQTDFEVGLTEEIADKVIAHLGVCEKALDEACSGK